MSKLTKLERAIEALDRTRQERLLAYNKVLAERTAKAQAIEGAEHRLEELVKMSRTERHPDLALMRVLSSTEHRLRTTLQALKQALLRFDKERVDPAREALTEAAVQVRAVESLLAKRRLDLVMAENKREAQLLDELALQRWQARARRSER